MEEAGGGGAEGWGRGRVGEGEYGMGLWRGMGDDFFCQYVAAYLYMATRRLASAQTAIRLFFSRDGESRVSTAAIKVGRNRVKTTSVRKSIKDSNCVCLRTRL